MTTTLILSSSSPARRALLSRLQLPFSINVPDIDETPHPHEPIDQLVLRLAREKAEVSAKKFPDAYIIGSDQVGIYDHTLLCKPLTLDNARQQLKLMSGQRVRFYNGLCLYHANLHLCELALETYDVTLRELTDEMIDAYLQKEQPLQCAGSIDIEGYGITLIDKLEGRDYSALVGLPLIQLTSM